MTDGKPLSDSTPSGGGGAPQLPLGSPPHGQRALGAYGEEAAVRQLHESGLEILDRNWRCPDGELDVIAREGPALVICEVKTRSGAGFGTPLDAVTQAKAARLRRLARCWLSEQRVWFDEVRFDVVSVLCTGDGIVSIEHVRGVC